MSNNNNTRNIYNTTAGRTSSSSGGHGAGDNDEMEVLLSQSNASQHAMGNNQTAINIESDMTPGTSQQHLQRQQLLQQMRRDAVDTTRINMDLNVANVQNANGAENANIDERQRMPNLFAMLREARHQLNRSQSLRDAHPAVATANGEYTSANAHPRTWRENLYDVLSSPVSPRTDVLRAIFAPVSTASVRYDTLPTNDALPDEQFHFLINRQNEADVQPPFRSHNSSGLETQSSSSSSALRLSRQNSRLTDDRSLNENSSSAPQTPAIDIPIDSNSAGAGGGSRRQSNAAASATNAGRLPQRQTSATGSTTAPTIDMIDDADTNAVGEIIVKLVTHFVRYLPFIFIIFVKFIHDHLLGILDILILHGVVYQLNKSLKDQIAKLNQKSYAVLVRDMALVVCVVSYRFILSTSNPDPFGLLINPPGATITLDLFSAQKTGSSNVVSADELINQFTNSKNQIDEVPSSPTTNPLNSTISVTKTISLGALLYYVAVNDLILKLLTQLIKVIVTMLPTKAVRHKSRARLYALIEYISQFYRALVPMRQWLTFLFESYTGLEVISGILFSAFYMGAKGFEFVERGKPLKKALINFVRNMDYDRKPTKDELEAAGTVCPICHDSYTTPVVLECGHIFCDECVNTWFKREQTCPMCRAKVSEDPTWQDGATTYFYQLC
ncbi:E3 ubiquitin-protein ligase RNFT1 [Calliphora vicina]|uniref:E3 ubiquitin-protein ligase RNFT1 n=1 Tax=Calliphora vicina TaxID=7373 RepID=UPI00325BE052